MSTRLQRQQYAQALGLFIAQLAVWDWFVTLTVRDVGVFPRPAAESSKVVGKARKTAFKRDPRIDNWQPRPRRVGLFGSPHPGWVLRAAHDFMREVQNDADAAIGYVLAEELGSLGGRFHLHALVAGVPSVSRRKHWERWFTCYGRCRIEPPNLQRAVARYVSAYVRKQLGGIHFCGSLSGVDLAAVDNRPPQAGGGVEIVRSAELPKELYHMGMVGRRHR